MFDQAINTCAHVQLCSNSAGAISLRPGHRRHGCHSLQICSYDFLAGCVSERCATGESLSKGSSRRLKFFVRNDSVNDVPSLEGRGVVLVGRINNFACATRADPFSKTLNAAQQRGRSNRCLDLPEASRRSRPYQIACKCEFQSGRHTSPLHGSDSWKRQFFQIGDRSQMAGEALARFLGSLILENRDISTARKVFAIGARTSSALSEDAARAWSTAVRERSSISSWSRDRFSGGFAKVIKPRASDVSKRTLPIISLR